MSDKFKICPVCGVPIGSLAAYSNRTTCDKICTRARNLGISRDELIRREEAEPYPENDGTGCKTCGMHNCICKER